MYFDIRQGIAVLGRTPGTLRAMLHDPGTAWIDATEGPETRGAYDIVGHLVHVVDVGHFAQTARVMAKRSRDAIGPWRPYSPIVDR